MRLGLRQHRIVGKRTSHPRMESTLLALRYRWHARTRGPRGPVSRLLSSTSLIFTGMLRCRLCDRRPGRNRVVAVGGERRRRHRPTTSFFDSFTTLTAPSFLISAKPPLSQPLHAQARQPDNHFTIRLERTLLTPLLPFRSTHTVSQDTMVEQADLLVLD